MNLTLLGNLFFYLSPFIAMILHRWDHIFSEDVKKLIQACFLLVPLIWVWEMVYPSVIPRRLFFGTFPDYLIGFYAAGHAVLSIYYLNISPTLKSVLRAFLVVYVASFLWEIPINLKWIEIAGFHTAVIFHLIGVYPFIFLYKQSKTTVEDTFLYVITPILFTAYMMVFFPIWEWTFIAWEHYFSYGATLALVCRAVAFACLGHVFKPFVSDTEPRN